VDSLKCVKQKGILTFKSSNRVADSAVHGVVHRLYQGISKCHKFYSMCVLEIYVQL